MIQLTKKKVFFSSINSYFLSKKEPFEILKELKKLQKNSALTEDFCTIFLLRMSLRLKENILKLGLVAVHKDAQELKREEFIKKYKKKLDVDNFQEIYSILCTKANPILDLKYYVNNSNETISLDERNSTFNVLGSLYISGTLGAIAFLIEPIYFSILKAIPFEELQNKIGELDDKSYFKSIYAKFLAEYELNNLTNTSQLPSIPMKSKTL